MSVVEEDRDDVLLEMGSPVLERDEIGRVRGPQPGPDRLRPAACRRSDIIRGDPAGPGVADRGEEAELKAEVDDPALVEPGDGGSQLLEPILPSHGPIVAWRLAPSAASAARAASGATDRPAPVFNLT